MTFTISYVLLILIISVGINILMFIPAFIFKTDKLTDISYAVTFVVVALAGYLFSQRSDAQLIALILIVAWAIRLGTFLFIRISKNKRDARFDGMRESFIKFLGFWLLQGITVFLILIPGILLWSQTNTVINWFSILGIAIFVIGLSVESVADIQKNQFRNCNLKTWIDTGIWRASRHPNYLGEILIWIGMYIFIAPSLTIIQSLIALIGPIYITLLLAFVSGIPILEKSANKKWGDNKAYQKYKSDVPVLVPNLSSIRRAYK